MAFSGSRMVSVCGHDPFLEQDFARRAKIEAFLLFRAYFRNRLETQTVLKRLNLRFRKS